jgi:hypothetical protein
LTAASGQRGHILGDGFELADGLAAKEQRDEGTNRHHHQNRAEEDYRRSGVQFDQKRRHDTGEQPAEWRGDDRGEARTVQKRIEALHGLGLLTRTGAVQDAFRQRHQSV